MGRHQKTLAAVFANPVRADVKWRNVESLLASLGAIQTQGAGSRVHFDLNGGRSSCTDRTRGPRSTRGL